MNLPNSTMKKNFVPIVDFSQSSWSFVRLLLYFSIAEKFTMPFRSQICAPFAQYWKFACSNEDTSYSCRKSILVGSIGGYDLHPQEHPIHGNVLRLDYIIRLRNSGSRMNRSWILWKYFFLYFFRNWLAAWYSLSPCFQPYRCP